jgi:hypothetical protein
MSTIINHPQAAGEGGAPSWPPLPVPPPERLRQIFAFTDALFALYGPDRGTWPPVDQWPWHLLPADGAR